jgi:hypothetical protein
VAVVAAVAAAVEAAAQLERSRPFSQCEGNHHSREWFPRTSSTQAFVKVYRIIHYFIYGKVLKNQEASHLVLSVGQICVLVR